jgi:hypothetical protein
MPHSRWELLEQSPGWWGAGTGRGSVPCARGLGTVPLVPFPQARPETWALAGLDPTLGMGRGDLGAQGRGRGSPGLGCG